MEIPVKFMTYDTRQNHWTKALIDSGCTISAIDKDFVTQKRINTFPVKNPMPVYNADGIRNGNGDITEAVELHLEINGHKE